MIDFGSVLRLASESSPSAMPAVLAKAATDLGASNLVIYLVDFGRTTLEPLPDQSTRDEIPVAASVEASMAGRAFTGQTVVTAERDDGVRVWAPILEGSDCTGVVALTVPVVDDGMVRTCEELGLLAGYLIAAQARCTDVYNLYRRRRSMSLAASMQWDLLPPLVLHTERVAVAGMLEPAYDVGGDCFDYAANGPNFDFAIMDAMGHGVGSAVTSALAVGCYRHDRREGRALVAMHANLMSTIQTHYGTRSFATGVLGRIEVGSGVLTWTNAGHPLPLLIRGGQVVRELDCPPTPPWGIVGGEPTLATEQLEPGDSVFLYTDGVIEARTPEGDEFGLERMIDFVGRYCSEQLSLDVVVHQLVARVRDHQSADLTDDATVVLVRWDGGG